MDRTQTSLSQAEHAFPQDAVWNLERMPSLWATLAQLPLCLSCFTAVFSRTPLFILPQQHCAAVLYWSYCNPHTHVLLFVTYHQ